MKCWFNEARFGLFIHWGPYSVAARGEWVANRERIPQAEYAENYAARFLAENYDPRQWADLAKKAGMRYAVLTTRHHDGFALWPTSAGEFHAGAIGAKRDLVGPFVEAFRSAGLKIGLYYSPADWYHPDYPGAYFRDWPSAGDWKSNQARTRFIQYYKTQIIELLSNYGAIDYLWFDGCIPDNLQSKEVNEEALRIQPQLLINERNGEPWHVQICEQAIKPAPPGVLWEACMTLNENWGYHAGDDNWKSPRDVVGMLVKTASAGGNLLLNVGPKSDGTIPVESCQILEKVGAWLEKNGEAIYDSERSMISWNHWGGVTGKGNQLFLHVHKPVGPELCFAELKNKIRSAFILETRMPVSVVYRGDRAILQDLPCDPDESLGYVIVLDLDGKPQLLAEQANFWIPG